MLGAIIGDIVGSAYEFNPTNDYDFEMFGNGSGFTDDTICTVAVADAILRHKDYGESLHEWCRRYPNPKGGYGGRFHQWVMSDNPKPYNSLGNGSAMRVSPVAWAFANLVEAMHEAAATAECTHNHPEGIKGAEAVAMAIHFGRELRMTSGSIDKRDIVEALRPVLEYTRYDINIRRADVQNRFDETCPGTVPVALWIISESNGFEDAIRKAVSLGADADTLGAIVGSIAEAIWGVPENLALKAMSYLPEEMKSVIIEFYRKYCWEEFPIKSLYDEKFLNPYKNSDCFDFDAEVYEASKYVEENQLYYSTGGKTGTLKGRMTPSMINHLNKNEVFVFGSNKLGHHMGGAAKAAMDKFGAIWGQGDGLQGQSYAINTMDGLLETAINVNRFIDFAAAHQELTFFVTPIGCGIAGYTPLQIAPLFTKAIALPNVYLPRIFWEYFWQVNGICPEFYEFNKKWNDWK